MTTNESEITVGYWSIRGLGAPLRMMTLYAGSKLVAVNYDCGVKSDGSWDFASWHSVKPALKEKYPLINLPYIKDGDKIISQTNACFLYLGRKFNMLGPDQDSLSKCEQLLCEAMDLRDSMIFFVYNPASTNEDARALVTRKHGKNDVIFKLELWLAAEVAASHSGTFFVADTATAPDFHIWEMLDQYTRLCEYYGFEPFLASFPLLAKFKESFQALPQNQKYLSSPLHTKLPLNNKMAKFGAAPNGDHWNLGQKYDFAESSGIY